MKPTVKKIDLENRCPRDYRELVAMIYASLDTLDGLGERPTQLILNKRSLDMVLENRGTFRTGEHPEQLRIFGLAVYVREPVMV